ncbi:Uncharacterised protein [Serratia marcescens]|uniref:Uncharacterized protein n=1 Tax=Serratia marcescens TaxID=615 RepID=A0A380AEA8_SERMA|nr:hypothetical protein [Serratia marcescens]KFD11379.1 hypothetical protein GSMA_04254 [Serratia marcescens subsp. marcescens ATCC 13880]KFL02144.1 hypothetical protein DP21_3947 [Serratia marcescens]CAI0932554.1 Uncharacterised protein [Serratia marcescens]CAI1769795.1 Uncharacterised protein [Serratia marcescens]CAI1920408.1 Uncharacterised protein [Serratia marcescens]
MSSKSRVAPIASHTYQQHVKEQRLKEMQAFHKEWWEQRRREWRERGGIEASEAPARGIDTELSS